MDDRLIAQYYEHYCHDLRDWLPKLADRLATGEIFEFNGSEFNKKLPFSFIPDNTCLQRRERSLFWINFGDRFNLIQSVIKVEKIPFENSKLKITITDSIGGKHESQAFDFDKTLD